MERDIEFKVNQDDITPFWQKLPFFFSFPFRFGPLIFLICIVAASFVAGWVMGPFGLLFKGTLVYLGLRYGFNVLELFARGRFEGDSPDHRLWGPEKRPGKLGLVIALFIVLSGLLGNVLVDSRLQSDTKAQQIIVDQYNKEHAAELAAMEREREAFNKRIGLDSPAPVAPGAAAQEDDEDEPATTDAPGAHAADAADAPPMGLSKAEIVEANKPQMGSALWFKLLPVWYWLVVALLSLMLPAAAIVIALEDAFFRALNPGNVLYFIQIMGGAYFVLWGFVLLIGGLRQSILRLGAQWPTWVQFPIEMALGNYLAIVLFALMGYTLYQFHQKLHLDVDVDFDAHRQAGGAEAIATAGGARAAVAQRAKPTDPLDAKIAALVEEGKVGEAIAEIKDQMRYDKLNAGLNNRLHKLYVKQGDAAATLAHGPQWIKSLVHEQQHARALDALHAMRKLDAAFTLPDGDTVLPLARAAYGQADKQLAAALIKGFDKRFPKHPDIPEVYFLGARLLSELGGQHGKASQLLAQVISRYPDHATVGEMTAYQQVLESMASKAAGAGALRAAPNG